MPISIDTDPVNAEKRRHLYLLWRDVLMKLAAADTLKHKEFERFSRKTGMERGCKTIVWDLRINTYAERTPERISRII